MKNFIVILISFLFLHAINAQVVELPVRTGLYPFIHYEKDSFIFCEKQDVFSDLFYKLDSIILFGKGKLSIVHVGGSHIQADMYTERMREYMQGLCNDCNAGRGLVTPYKIAHTNNPLNYTVSYSGDWEYASIAKSKTGYNYGVSGLTLLKKSRLAQIYIDPNRQDSSEYAFNIVKIFHNLVNGLVINPLDSLLIDHITTDTLSGLTTLILKEEVKDIHLSFFTPDSITESVFIYGISLESENPGIVYHTIGINGASFRSYLKAELLPEQLKALEPDLCIISIGTNDANTRGFDADLYVERYKLFLDNILKVCPNVKFLLTVPNDSKMFGRYVNRNTEMLRKKIVGLGCEYGCGVWDFYTIMGGLNSIEKWYEYGLARPDYIHFNEKGYELKGDLFFNAFFNLYNGHINYIEVQNNER